MVNQHKVQDVQASFSENRTGEAGPQQNGIEAIQSIKLPLMQKKRSKPLAKVHLVSAAGAELPPERAEELWVRPNYNLHQQRQEASEGNITPESGQRLLELADIALGLKKPSAAKRKSKALSAEAHHEKMQYRKKRPQGPA